MILLLVLLAFSAAAAAEGGIPLITRQVLQDAVIHHKRDVIEGLRDSGGRFGAFAITDLEDPDYTKVTSELNLVVADCLEADHLLPQIELSDGSLRRTFATETGGHFPECLSEHMDIMSGMFNSLEFLVSNLAERIAGRTLQYIVGSNSVRMLKSPWKDHIHLYTRQSSNDSNGNSMVPYHVDNGLFLLLTPFPGHGIQVKASDKTVMTTDDLPMDSILVLFGLGITDWLLQEEEEGNNPFFAVPHSVPSLAGSNVNRRTVYARMKVAPGLAVPSSKAKSNGNRKKRLLTFDEVFMRTVAVSSSRDSQVCSVNLNPWTHSMQQQCEEGVTAYCWMSCLPLPEGCEEEHSICMDDAGNECEPEDMNADCKWQCKAQPCAESNGTTAVPTTTTATDDNHINNFCSGGSMDMFMQGFQVSGQSKNPCIILFFNAWTLDSPVKFGFGCLGVFILGISIEMCIAFRRRITKKDVIFKPVLMVICFGINLMLGYFAMLVAMTYSVELFLCVSLGIILGHAIFNVHQPVSETIDPCCATQAAGQKGMQQAPLPEITYEHVFHTPPSVVKANNNCCNKSNGECSRKK